MERLYTVIKILSRKPSFLDVDMRNLNVTCKIILLMFLKSGIETKPSQDPPSPFLPVVQKHKGYPKSLLNGFKSIQTSLKRDLTENKWLPHSSRVNLYEKTRPKDNFIENKYVFQDHFSKPSTVNILSSTPAAPVMSELHKGNNKIISLESGKLNSHYLLTENPHSSPPIFEKNMTNESIVKYTLPQPRSFNRLKNYPDFDHIPPFFTNPIEQKSRLQYPEEPIQNFGLSYLSSKEARPLLTQPLQHSFKHKAPGSTLLSNKHYQSDSGETYQFPRFNIPLKSLQLGSNSKSYFNTEGSEIIEPTFIVPEDEKFPRATIPESSKPVTTHGVSVDDGLFSRKEIRKDNGEFFSSYVGSDVMSANVGSLVPTSAGDQVLVQKGSYSFTTPEGLKFRVDYMADDTGFHATQVPVTDSRIL